MGWLTDAIANAVGKITSWISGAFTSLLDNIFGFIYSLFQMLWDYIIGFIAGVLAGITDILGLGNLGFSMGSLVADVWGWLMIINDFFPVLEVFAMVTVYVSVWAIVFIINWSLRLIPTVSGGAGGSA